MEKLIHITDSDNPSNFRRSSYKKLWGNTLICRFLQGIWLHTQRGDRTNTSSVWSPHQKIVAAIMMLYKNTKVKVCSLVGDSDFFDVADVLQVDTLAPYLFLIFLDYVLRMLIDLMKENGFMQKKARSRWYPMQTIMDADYMDDMVLLANTPTQAESLLHSLGQTASDISLHVNADKTEYMCLIKKETSLH